MDSNLSKRFGSVRSAHSYDQHISSRQTASSFVTINQKRSWRPPPYLFQPVLDFMANAAPLALAAANPFLRLYVERNESGGGFLLDGYQVTPLFLEEQCGLPESGDSAALRHEYGGLGGLSAADGGGDSGCGSPAYSGPSRGTSGFVVEDDAVGDGWVGEDEDNGSVRDDASEPRSSFVSDGGGGAAGVLRLGPFYLQGLGGSQGVSQCSCHRYPRVGVDRLQPASTQAICLSLKSNAPMAADIRDRGCLRECWLGAAAELSLCVNIVCKSDAALRLSALGGWWLSRYYGVSLRLSHMHPAQLTAFKEVQRSLFIKELRFEFCTLSEDFLQCISTSADLLSLSIISCSASQEVTLRCIDSILRKGPAADASAARVGVFADAVDGAEPLADGKPARADAPTPTARATAATATVDPRRAVTNWYLSGVRSLGLLRRLRCLHILHTPLHETFLQALATCTSLECLILHRCRGVRSLEPLRQLKQLQSLSLHGLSTTDAEVLALGTLPGLRQLVLDECRNITDLSFLAQLRRTLERLFIPRTLLSSANLKHVGLLDKLVELDVHSLRQLTELDQLKDLTSLRVLIARDNLLTGQGCTSLRFMSSLQRLDLSCCRCLTSLHGVIGTNSKWAQRLHSLNLSQTAMTDEGLVCVEACTELRYLNLSQCSAVQQLSFLRKMTALRWLHLSGTSVTDAEASRFLPSAGALRLLSLAGCSGVRSLEFVRKLPLLEYLDLESTAVTDSELEHLRRCRRLRFLSLQRCSAVCRLDPLVANHALLELNVSMTAVGSGPGGHGALLRCSGDEGGRQRSAARSEGDSSPSQSADASPTSQPSTNSSAFASPSSPQPPPLSVLCLPSVQVLHLNGCSRISRLDGVTKSFPQLRILYADRISVASPRSTVGIGFAGMDELRRTRHSPRQRGVLLNVTVDGETPSESQDSPEHPSQPRSKNSAGFARHNPPVANKSASQLDQVLQQYVPQPPANPRPRTAHAAMARPHHRGHSMGANGDVLRPASGPATTADAARVLRLVVRRSSLTDSMLFHMCATFWCVTSLDLTKCVDVQSLSGLERLSLLRELYLTQSSVDNEGVQAVSACESLEVLRLSECRNVTDVNCLCSLRRLRTLSMERTQVTSQGFVGVGECRSLQFLSCSECRYLADVNTLGNLQRLIELHLELTDVRDAGIRGLLKCSSLQRVYFTRCQRLTTVGEMRSALPQLEVLDVYGTSIPTRVAGQGQQFACVVM